MLTAELVLALAVVVGLTWGSATPAILRQLPEPSPRPETSSVPDEEASGTGCHLVEVKIPYASLATHTFAAMVGALAASAITISALALPIALLPVWLVLGTFGVLLAAVDARTTWLPLPLTRAAWLTTVVAVGLGGLLGGWMQAVRGLVGFVLAGSLFGIVWLLTRGGFGFGDVRYAPLVGAATASASWTVLAWALVLGSLVGALTGIVRLSTGRHGAFAYAPSILAGGYLAVVLRWLTT